MRSGRPVRNGLDTAEGARGRVLESRSRRGFRTIGSYRFNGAVPMKARKFQNVPLRIVTFSGLQWGRANEGTEMKVVLVNPELIGGGFNGAVPMKARKSVGVCLIPALCFRASMGPCR